MDKTGNVHISAIVCTHNRAASLARTLYSLVFQSLDPSRYEIIVVDNNSCDNTKGVTANIKSQLPVDINYIFEPRQGLSYARNTGLRLAKAPIVAFTDDDVIAASNWLECTLHEFFAGPEVQALGGKVEPWNNENPQLCITSLQAREVYWSRTRLAGIIHGNNMAFRRSIFDVVGVFDEHLGAGSACRAGEDVDMLYRVLQLGEMVVYSPRAKVFHNHSAMTPAEMFRQLADYAMGYGAFLMKHMLGGDLYAARLLLKELKILRWQYMRATDQTDLPTKTFVRRKLAALIFGMGLIVKAKVAKAITPSRATYSGAGGWHCERLLTKR